MPVKPDWIRVAAPTTDQAASMDHLRHVLSVYRLHTVCQGAVCPNAVRCWGAKTATFMILGKICTRACRFCGVPTGDPGGHVDRGEPERLAQAVVELALEYVVLTSVDRDDLADGGSETYAECVDRVRLLRPTARLELLVPDFGGNRSALERILSRGVDVFAHNIETVRSRSSNLRDHRADYDRSLDVLSFASRGALGARIKSGLMVGLGETQDDLRATFDDLARVGVEGLTIGQYLKPSRLAVDVDRYVRPEEFERIASAARAAGIPRVLAGPMVRSSFRASELFWDPCG